MKREEKNSASRQKILQSAFQEFASKGYGLGSVNTICSEGDISKGILYHYFKDKDEIYLTCVKLCFDQLTEYMRLHSGNTELPVQEQLNRYFEVRFDFFLHNPLHQRMFCDAVITPPDHLRQEISELRVEFDHFNISLLNKILDSVKLRNDVSRQDVIETFRQYQDFINASYRQESPDTLDVAEHEKRSRLALSILLYGVVSREEAIL